MSGEQISEAIKLCDIMKRINTETYHIRARPHSLFYFLLEMNNEVILACNFNKFKFILNTKNDAAIGKFREIFVGMQHD